MGIEVRLLPFSFRQYRLPRNVMGRFPHVDQYPVWHIGTYGIVPYIGMRLGWYFVFV